MSFVQSVLLRDIQLTFSGLIHNKNVIQEENNILTTLCRGITTLTTSIYPDEATCGRDVERAWMAWLLTEEVVRLAHCVHGENPFKNIGTNHRQRLTA